MKIGFCMLLWTTSVVKKHEALLRDIKATGYDGVEIPIFVGTPDDYRKLGATLDAIGLERTAVTAMGDPQMNLISPDAATRKAGIDYMKWAIDCCRGAGREDLVRADALDDRRILRQPARPPPRRSARCPRSAPSATMPARRA